MQMADGDKAAAMYFPTHSANTFQFDLCYIPKIFSYFIMLTAVVGQTRFCLQIFDGWAAKCRMSLDTSSHPTLFLCMFISNKEKLSRHIYNLRVSPA